MPFPPPDLLKAASSMESQLSFSRLLSHFARLLLRQDSPPLQVTKDIPSREGTLLLQKNVQLLAPGETSPGLSNAGLHRHPDATGTGFPEQHGQ
jgi:hypothetical protein